MPERRPCGSVQAVPPQFVPLSAHFGGPEQLENLPLSFEVVPEKAVLRCREGDVRNQYVSFLPAMPPFHISIYPGSQMRVQGLSAER